ncbi:MAG: aminotransferase class I/II-fold pyridoxal phosphate-dependent enzyme [Saprospiraceae bacterium]
MKNNNGFGSQCVHDVKIKSTTDAHSLPIYATSSFEFSSIEQGMKVFTGEEAGHLYSRFGNPTIESVAAKIARLETYKLDMEAYCYLFSSGMAAIATLALGTLKPGQKILTQGNLYGGTTELFNRILKPLNITPVLTDLRDPDEVERLLKADDSIRMIYFETPANPTLACVDIPTLVDLGKRYDCLVTADNTFSSPYVQQPFAFGVDFIVHSTTKYLNGHGNSTGGALIGKVNDGHQDDLFAGLKLVGANSNAWDAWLINNGMKTLELRMIRHCSNALAIAEYLEKHPKVEQVNYPGLPSHPDHQLAKRQMKAFGGMLSFELAGGLEAGKEFMDKLQFCTLAPTMGDVDTLVLHPASMSHLRVPREVRIANQITDGLIRLSVGIENVEDIITDLEQAMG